MATVLENAVAMYDVNYVQHVDFGMVIGDFMFSLSLSCPLFSCPKTNRLPYEGQI